MAERKRMRRARGFALRALIPTQLSLGVLWLFLWGEFTWTTLLTGFIVATVVPLVFYLPPTESRGRAHIGWILWFVLKLFLAIARSSVIVAGQAFGIRYSRDAAVIGVRLRTSSDLILTAVAEASTLVPGTLVIDVDRENRDLYLHVFSVRSPQHIERARRDVLATEALVILAIGSREEVQMVRDERRASAGLKGSER